MDYFFEIFQEADSALATEMLSIYPRPLKFNKKQSDFK